MGVGGRGGVCGVVDSLGFNVQVFVCVCVCVVGGGVLAQFGPNWPDRKKGDAKIGHSWSKIGHKCMVPNADLKSPCMFVFI